ncbi:MAG: response regulator transcription factor [Rhodospirillales bacterium]|nr:response regulator transcription factor [Rhodospirillales bacterium]
MSKQNKILIVDDEPDICEIVEMVLGDAGYIVSILSSGANVVDHVREHAIDLVVLDLGLPDVDGLSLTRTLKERSDVSVVILSGRGETTEKIIGLEIGADDYMGKPFEPRELLARVRSVLRRKSGAKEPVAESHKSLSFDGWKLDLMVRALAAPDGTPVSMSSGEFNLLRAFASHPNRVMSRDQLLNYTHDLDSPAYDRSVDVQIARLRKKIEPDPQNPTYIKTIRNAGYIFTAKVEQV